MDSWGIIDDNGLSPDDSLQTLIDLPPYLVTDDKHGHNVPISARISTGLKKQLDVLQYKQGSPYNTPSELYRDCIKLGATIVAMRIDSSTWILDAKLAEHASRIEIHKRLYDRCDELVEHLGVISNYDEEQASVDLQEFLELVENSPDANKYYIALNKKLLALKLKELADIVPVPV